MPPKVSFEMKEALRLVKAGVSGREAARQAGVREESLYRNAEYRACMDAKPKHAGGRPKLPEGQKLVQRSIRLSADHWAKIDQYGLDWLRQLIQRGKPPADRSEQ